MRQVVRSFLGPKKEEDFEENTTTNNKENSTFPTRCRSFESSARQTKKLFRQTHLPERSQSCLDKRSSTLQHLKPRHTEEWDVSSLQDYRIDSFSGAGRTVSSPAQSRTFKNELPTKLNRSANTFEISSQENPSKKHSSGNGWKTFQKQAQTRLSNQLNAYENENLISSAENTSSHQTTLPERLNEQPCSLKQRSASSLNLSNFGRNQHDFGKQLPRTHSLSATDCPQLPSRRISHASNASERLMSCMDTLEHLSKRLESVTKVSKEIDHFREVNDQLTAMHISPLTEKDSQPRHISRSEWNEEQYNFQEFPQNHPLPPQETCFDNLSTDSGLEYESPSRRNYANRSSRSKPLQHTTKSASQFDDSKQNFTGEQHIKQHSHIRSDSMSSGYSSGSSGTHGYFQQYEVAPHQPYISRGNYNVNTLSGNRNSMPMYGHKNEVEDIYGYGSFGYASSSVYDEDLNEVNGWFYLPSSAHNQVQLYPEEYPTHGEYSAQHGIYATQNTSYPAYHQGHNPHFATDQLSHWQHGERYGPLSDRFLDPSAGMSPLAAAISNNYAESTSSISSIGSKPDRGKYGSFRCRNGMVTAVVPPNGYNRRRKTVRFSQTVKQRVETESSEMKDSTSNIKGYSAESPYDVPSSQPAYDGSEENLIDAEGSLCEQPIYEFPSGHIESSCMCSDCILARGSCQLQSTKNLMYY
ncbi:unnamed protein product [Clavelina lepadiformis]|uniref:Uncharacterized protein n=1 Tax=Clavelina lepadiformis TaxID=159417 RepID=A0ABP0G3M2_CLALP